jgi:hypothetical protein
MNRYRDGYLHAKAVNGLGATVKVIALVLGGLVAVVGFISCSGSASMNSMGAGIGELGGGLVFLVGAAIGLMGFVFGVMVQSAGQQLKAHLDCAVTASPFLTDQQKAVAMSLV